MKRSVLSVRLPGDVIPTGLPRRLARSVAGDPIGASSE